MVQVNLKVTDELLEEIGFTTEYSVDEMANNDEEWDRFVHAFRKFLHHYPREEVPAFYAKHRTKE